MYVSNRRCFKLPLLALLAGCGGQTSPTSSPRDARADAPSKLRDASQVVDSSRMSDVRVVFADGSPCAILISCCTFVPGVYQGFCMGEALRATEGACSSALYGFVQNDQLDGGPCTGIGHGTTPACTTLASCCGSAECGQLVEAGAQDACAGEYFNQIGQGICQQCSGDCAHAN
jgi:hypothetical protein